MATSGVHLSMGMAAHRLKLNPFKAELQFIPEDARYFPREYYNHTMFQYTSCSSGVGLDYQLQAANMTWSGMVFLYKFYEMI